MERPASNRALEHLLASESHVWRGLERRATEPGVPSGYAALDESLPDGGWSRGGVTELMTDTPGIGELSLALPALRALTTEGHHAVLVNPPHLPYAPALANAGIALERLIVVEGESDEDGLWASEQLLRDGVVALLALWVTRTTPARQRRLQLAAEGGRAVALVYRPASARDEHSPVGARLVLAVEDGQLVLDVVKARGGRESRVSIAPSAFDAPQGAEWPLVPPEIERAAGAATGTAADVMNGTTAPAISLDVAANVASIATSITAARAMSAPIVVLAPRALPDAPSRCRNDTRHD